MPYCVAQAQRCPGYQHCCLLVDLYFFSLGRLAIGKTQVNFGLALYGRVHLGTAVIVFLAAAMAEYHASVYLASMAIGMQNGVAATYSGAVARTTHMTGIVTDLVGVGNALAVFL